MASTRKITHRDMLHHPGIHLDPVKKMDAFYAADHYQTLRNILFHCEYERGYGGMPPLAKLLLLLVSELTATRPHDDLSNVKTQPIPMGMLCAMSGAERHAVLRAISALVGRGLLVREYGRDSEGRKVALLAMGRRMELFEHWETHTLDADGKVMTAAEVEAEDRQVAASMAAWEAKNAAPTAAVPTPPTPVHMNRAQRRNLDRQAGKLKGRGRKRGAAGSTNNPQEADDDIPF